jgi:hypothetical protein
VIRRIITVALAESISNDGYLVLPEVADLHSQLVPISERFDLVPSNLIGTKRPASNR